MIYFILILIIVVCLGVVFYLIGNKVRKLKLVAVEAIPQEKQTAVKKRLLELRLQKRLAALGSEGVRGAGNIAKMVWRLIEAAVRLLAKIKKPRGLGRRTEKVGVKREIKAISPIENKILEAEVLIKKRKWDEAEEKYIEILKDDPKNVGVFMALGEIYTARKEWPLAEETYRHVMRVDPKFLPAQKELVGVLEIIKNWEDLKKITQYILKNEVEEAWVFMKLGLSYKKTGYPDIAEEYFERAVELEPKNESTLDYLIETAIINKNKPLALKAFNTLLGVSADGLKIQSYKDKIDIL